MKRKILIAIILPVFTISFLAGAVFGATAWTGTVTATTTEPIVVMNNVGQELASPWTYAAGSMIVGTSKTITLLVKNIGVAPISVTPTADFTLSPGITGIWNPAIATPIPVYNGSNAVQFVLTLTANSVQAGTQTIGISFTRP